MAHKVKCFYCGESFDRDNIPCVKVTDRRYVHQACYELYKDSIDEDAKVERELNDFIRELYGKDNKDLVKVYVQLAKYKTQYKLTNDGVLKTLKYVYQIKRGKFSINKSNFGIGIIPYVYAEALQYFDNIERAKKINENKVIETDSVQIVIPPPKRQVTKRHLFSFLDEET